eukprot:scaffold232286_cov66-Cyclotella_meneghiniana.AAC.1
MGGGNSHLEALISHQDSAVLGLAHALHSSWTVPMSHLMYNECYGRVENGIHPLQWSVFSISRLLSNGWG